MEYDIELIEFMDQVDFCLSLRFKEKWRHKYSSHFIRVFQEKVFNSIEIGLYYPIVYDDPKFLNIRAEYRDSIK